ncbi:unnamed protein product [Orchesella dallaii]|uniref:Uncharacterized protein n=1 Tax=Orchesella dallaii TaxID=48710 RepID=A0ABP1QDX0_9HEXA
MNTLYLLEANSSIFIAVQFTAYPYITCHTHQKEYTTTTTPIPPLFAVEEYHENQPQLVLTRKQKLWGCILYKSSSVFSSVIKATFMSSQQSYRYVTCDRNRNSK